MGRHRANDRGMGGIPINSKERVYAALEGRPVDRMPVTVLYSTLYHLDHFAELSGKAAWERHQWLHASPEEHLALYMRMVEQAPFEILEPHGAPSCEMRKNLTFYEKNDVVFRHNRKDDTTTRLAGPISGHAADGAANQTQYVFNTRDFDMRFRLIKAEDLLERGHFDYIQAAVRMIGRDRFILSGGFVSVLWKCIPFVGYNNMLTMLIDNPELIEYMSRKILEQKMEAIRAYAAVGGDALYIDDAMGYSDVISVAHYERFSLPYLTEMVKEIHRQGMKVILIYFGGVSDRLEQIVSTGADGLSVETTMKNYVNDIREISRKIGSRISLFGNIDPVGVLQNGSDGQLEAEIRKQARAAKNARGFIMCTGSPITPSTPLARVRLFIELSQRQVV